MSQKHAQAVRDLVKGAGVVYTGLVLEMLLAFIAQLLAARSLSLSGFGGVTTGTALINIGSVIATIGLGEGLVRYLPRADSDDQRRMLMVLSFMIVVPISITIGALVAFNAEFIAGTIFDDRSVTTSIRIFGAVIPFGTVISLSVNGIRGRKRSQERVYIENIVRPATRFLLVAGVVTYGATQTRVATAYALPYVFGAILGILLFVRALPDAREARSLFETFSNSQKLVAEFLQYSLPFTLHGAAGFIFRGSDIFLLLAMTSSDVVGTYGVAYAVARLVLMFSTAFNYLGAPIASELEATDGTEGMVNVQDSVTRWLVILSLPAILPFVFFPSEFISFIYQPRYASGALALVVLSVGFAIHNILSVQASMVRGLGNSQGLMTYNIVAAVSNVGLNLLLIPQYSFVGAAVATVVSYLIKDLLILNQVRIETGSIALSWRVLVPALLALPVYGLGYLAVGLFPSSFVGLLVFSTAFAILYVVTVIVAQGFTTVELMLVRSANEKYSLELTWLERFVGRFAERNK